MLGQDILERGYPVGTFKLGQKVWHVTERTHLFHIKEPCVFCDDTGFVLIKGHAFTCPACHNQVKSVIVKERFVDDNFTMMNKINSVITIANDKENREIYGTEPNGGGFIIQMGADGGNWYFASLEEAEQACAEYNEKHAVKRTLAVMQSKQLKNKVI